MVWRPKVATSSTLGSNSIVRIKAAENSTLSDFEPSCLENKASIGLLSF